MKVKKKIFKIIKYIFTLCEYWARHIACIPDQVYEFQKFRERVSRTLLPCIYFFSNIHGSREEEFLRLNTFSLYGHIVPILGSELLTKGHEFTNLGRRLYKNYNHAYIYFQIYMGEEKKIFWDLINFHYLVILILRLGLIHDLVGHDFYNLAEMNLDNKRYGHHNLRSTNFQLCGVEKKTF